MNLAVTSIILDYHVFSKLFWLIYKTLEKLYPDFDSVKMLFLKNKRIDPKYYKNIDGFDELLLLLQKEWDLKSEDAKNMGIATHEYIHNLLITNPALCKLQFLVPTDLYSILTDLLQNGIFVEKRLEVKLDDDYTLVGIPDYFIIDGDTVFLKDWKVSDDPIKFKSMYDASLHSAKKMKHPISSLLDVNGVHYLLLLSIYMWMLQLLRPDLKCGGLEIVWIKNNEIKKIYPVEYLDKQVDKLIKWHAKDLRLHNEMMKCREILY